jgi:hypothetical protein
MSFNFTYNNRSVLVTERARILFKRLESPLIQDRNDLHKSMARVALLFKEFYGTLGKPSMQLRPFENKQVPRSTKINATMQEIEDDLQIAYKEVDAIGQSFVEVFNLSRAYTTELSSLSARAASKVVDLRLISNQLDQNIIVAGDDFNDLSRVDGAFPLQNPKADIFISQGIATLNRVESTNLANRNTTIEVTPVAPTFLKRRPTVGNVDRFYEGNFYNFMGSARPEGGKWHLEESMTAAVGPGTGITTTAYFTDSSQTPNPSSPSAAQQAQANVNQYIENPNAAPNPGKRLRPQDIIVIDRGANTVELDNIRKRTLDENPSTFWECEYVKVADSLQESVQQSQATEQQASINNPNPQNPGQLEQDIINAAVTLDDLRAQAATISDSSDDDLIVDITIRLDSRKSVNWLSINPNNFEELAWIDVLNIEYAEDVDRPFIVIPNFNDNISEKVLTDEANAELSNEEEFTTLSSTKYSYKGIGVWTFSPVMARIFRIRLRQRRAVPSPYQRLVVRLHRVFTQVYTQTQAPDGGMM